MKKFFIILFTLFLFSGKCFAGMPAFLPAVKSSQEVAVTISALSLTGTGTLSPTVNSTYATAELIHFVPSYVSGVGFNDNLAYGAITAANQITATRIDSQGEITLRFRVTEYYPYAIKSTIQSGYVSGAANKAITEITTKRSFCTHAGTTSTDTTTPTNEYYYYSTVYLKDENEVTSYTNAGGTTKVYYYVVELQPWVCP